MLNQDFEEFVQSQNAIHVRCLVLDGDAVARHGHPRYTKDIDIWLEMNPANAVQLVRALEHFGFASLGWQASVLPDVEHLQKNERAGAVCKIKPI